MVAIGDDRLAWRTGDVPGHFFRKCPRTTARTLSYSHFANECIFLSSFFLLQIYYRNIRTGLIWEPEVAPCGLEVMVLSVIPPSSSGESTRWEMLTLRWVKNTESKFIAAMSFYNVKRLKKWLLPFGNILRKEHGQKSICYSWWGSQGRSQMCRWGWARLENVPQLTVNKA